MASNEAGAASNKAGAASKEEGAEEVVDIEAPEPKELDHSFTELDTTYPFQMSTWDASLFIGHKCIGSAGSVAMVLILFATVMVQGGFCWIAVDKLSKSQYGDGVTQNMHWWRTDAHLLQFGQGQLSLVERVCSSDPTLMVGTDMKQRIAMIRDYIPEFADSFITSGPSFVLLVLTIWYATLSKELHNIMNFSMAMVRIPKGPRTRLIVSDDGGVELAVLGRPRTVLAAFLAMVRLFLCAVLCYAGTLRTAYTTNWGGILLNALKLNLIAAVSDVLFAALMPHNVKALFKKLKPLRKPTLPAWKGLDVWACAVLILIPAGLVCAYSAVILPEARHQLDAYSALCSGDRTFQHQDLHGVIIRMDGAAYRRRDPRTSVLYEATRELIELDGAEPSGRLLSLEAPSQMYFEALARLAPMELSGALNQGCEDLLNRSADELRNWVYNYRHVEYLRRSTGDQSISSCEDVAHHCTTGFAGGEYQLSTVHARRFCPETCGCRAPDVLYDRNYCPMGYCENHADFRQISDARPCLDRNLTDLGNSTAWQSLARQMREAVTALPPELYGAAGATGLLSVATSESRAPVLAAQGLSPEDAHESLMLQLGCGYVTLGRNLSMSLGGGWGSPCGSRAIQHHCPVACDCHRGFPGWCPRQCR